MNLAEWLLGENSGNKDIAVISRERVISYEELFDLAGSVSANLGKKGCKGEKIIILSDNSAFFIIAYLGIIASGCTAVPLDKRISKKHVEHVIDKCNARAIFVQSRHFQILNSIGKKFEIVMSDADGPGCENIYGMPKEKPYFKEVDDKKDAAVIVFTSGSTAAPKGVMLSHFNIYCNTQSIIEYLSLNKKDRLMAILPFTYSYGASWIHTMLRAGGQIVINNEFMFPSKVLEEVNKNKCTGFAGVPTTFQILLRTTEFRNMEFPTLRFITFSGGKLPNACISELLESFPNKQIFSMYGLTEATTRASYLPPSLLREKIGSIGKGIPGTGIDVVDENGNSARAEATGEIVVTGGNIMLGYFDDPKGTGEAVKNGVLYTGDLGKKDNDGFVYLVGRKKEMIKSSGYRISPKEIEETIMELPQVVEVGVVGVEDDMLGEAIKAFVVANDSSITEESVIGYCKKNASPYKVPKYVEFVDSLPKNEYGKISLAALKIMGAEK